MLPENVKRILKRQHYALVGGHSAAKLCLWTKKSIKTGGLQHCYKEKFYKDIGIKSHRCLQCTPAVAFCSLRCEFCWRPITEATLGYKIPKEDEPAKIVNGLIQAQRHLLTGLGGVPHNERYLKEAQNPAHAAISLAGEPTCYSQIGELIAEFHKRNIKTFLVTNGTLPERLENLSTLPTQLYVSLCSNSKEMMKKIQNPLMPKAWERLNQTLEILSGIKTRKVVRLTMVKNLNMLEPEKYAKLIEKASPQFIEVKGYSAVGFARLRLGPEYMPNHAEIKEFSEKISNSTGYKIADEKIDSRVVLLRR